MGRGTAGQDEIGVQRAGGLARLRVFNISTARLEIELERLGLDESCVGAEVTHVNSRTYVHHVSLTAGDAQVSFDSYTAVADAEQLLKTLPDGGGEAALEIALHAYDVGFRAGYDTDRHWED